MQKTTRYMLLTALALLAIAILAMWRLVQGTGADGSDLVRWGHGRLTASEEAYYGNRIAGIISAWQQMPRNADREKDGRLKQPYDICLVIDTARRAIWIEDRGQILEAYRSEFPSQMTWKALDDSGNGPTPLADTVRLKYRGMNTDCHYPEMIWLTGQRGTNECLAFQFNCSSQSRSRVHGGGTFKPSHNAPARKDGVNYYGSIIVSDAEYEQSRRAWAALGIEESSVPRQQGQADPRQAAWLRVEKKLYQEVENQVMKAGFTLRHLEVNVGPDYSAAHARLGGGSDNLIRSLIGRAASFEAYLTIDRLGDDLWYVKTSADPRWPGGRRPGLRNTELDLEFVGSANSPVAKSDVPGWIAKGRKKQEPVMQPPSKWRATLANGTTIEFLGLCENPSGDRPWWGPDGSDLDYAPYFNREPYDRPRDDRRIYEIAWRVLPPGAAQGRGTTSLLAGNVGSYYRMTRDRYGNGTPAGLHAEGYAFDKALTKTTLTLGVKFGDQDYQYAHFKNISLVRGRNQDFEMEVAK
jgi:hypothetical protein